MSCADCAGEMAECVDCRADSAYAAAREEGRREERERIRALGPFTVGTALQRDDQDRCDLYNMAFESGREHGHKKGYDACTADVVAFLAQLPAANILAWIEAGEHVGAAGKGKP